MLPGSVVLLVGPCGKRVFVSYNGVFEMMRLMSWNNQINYQEVIF